MRSPALAFALLTLCLTACGGTDATSKTCNATAECDEGFVCAAGYCILEDRACSATSPCPGDLSCCGGTCKEGGCCLADVDCGGNGYCNSGACIPGSRGACDSDADCGGDAQCLTNVRQCVECVGTADCAPGYSCSPANACTTDSGCSAGSCLQQGKVCAPEQGACRNCVSDNECGGKICDATGTCIDCVASNQCTDDRVCTNGSCTRGQGTSCVNNADCGGLVCIQRGEGKTCEPCFINEECGPAGICTGGRCFATDGECLSDAECDYPSEICNYDTCEPGCATTGCSEGDICNPNTGRCVPFSDGTADLGLPCDSHDECLTNVCWPIDKADGTIVRLCGQSCVSTGDCPTGFVCHELGDGGTCLKPDFYTGGGARDVASGGACTDGLLSEQCRSGYCNDGANVCYETCANDNACNAWGTNDTCVLRRRVDEDKNGNGTIEPLEIAWTGLCQAGSPSALQSGAICATAGTQPQPRDHDKCDSGFCAKTVDETKASRCAEGCCTPSDCNTLAPICKPLDLWDGNRENAEQPFGFQKVCLAKEYNGAKELGATCNSNSECKSEICVAGESGVKRCTQTCCTNLDCAGLSWTSGCRPPFFDAGGNSTPVADQNFSDIVYALGRKFVGSTSTGDAYGITPICFPD